MKTEYVGYGPSVDAAWDVIANDSKFLSQAVANPSFSTCPELTVLSSWRYYDHGGGKSQVGLLSQVSKDPTPGNREMGLSGRR